MKMSVITAAILAATMATSAIANPMDFEDLTLGNTHELMTTGYAFVVPGTTSADYPAGAPTIAALSSAETAAAYNTSVNTLVGITFDGEFSGGTVDTQTTNTPAVLGGINYDDLIAGAKQDFYKADGAQAAWTNVESEYNNSSFDEINLKGNATGQPIRNDMVYLARENGHLGVAFTAFQAEGSTRAWVDFDNKASDVAARITKLNIEIQNFRELVLAIRAHETASFQ